MIFGFRGQAPGAAGRPARDMRKTCLSVRVVGLIVAGALAGVPWPLLVADAA